MCVDCCPARKVYRLRFGNATMPGPVFLSGDQVVLRTVEPDDYDFIHRYWNTPLIRHGTYRHAPQSKSHIAEFIEEAGDTSVHFLPCVGDKPVGFLWLFEIDHVSDRTEIGYWIIPDEQGKGYATETLRLGVRYAFDECGLHKIIAHVYDENEPSMRVLEKIGFEEEGCLHDHYYVNGKYVDAHVYGLLARGK